MSKKKVASRLVTIAAAAVVLSALALTGPAVRVAAAVSAADRCEAYQLAASGQRISAKLHCRAWAKLTDTPVDPACLDKAEKRFLLQLQDGGPDCAGPDQVVSLGAAADAQANAVVADVQSDSPTIPSVAGKWLTRSTIAFNPDGGAAVACEFYSTPQACPNLEMFLIIDCETRLGQDGATLTYDSICTTPPESPTQRETFNQAATGSVDLVTGESMVSGVVEIPGLDPIAYDGEGVFSADGRSSTGFTTAGYSGGGVEILWLASSVGHRVD